MRFFPNLSLSFILPIFIFSSNTPERTAYKIMFYNVENLFDTEASPTKIDTEFTPKGDRHWTTKKLDWKIEKLAKTIVAAGKWESPAIIGLCEIENLAVLEKLCNHPLLKKSNYRIIHKDSPDHRGIDVAMLYRNDLFIPEDYSTIPINNEVGKLIETREILHVTGHFPEGEKINFFINHWPSRYGGLMETESNRKLAATCLKKAIDETRKNEQDAKIVCMGDFNDQPADESLFKVLGALKPQDTTNGDDLVNLSWSWSSEKTGTIKHQQEWVVFDQFIVSNNLLSVSNASIFAEKFLLEPDKKFTGYKPFRTYNGFRYNGGFSDHLPILLEIQK